LGGKHRTRLATSSILTRDGEFMRLPCLKHFAMVANNGELLQLSADPILLTNGQRKILSAVVDGGWTLDGLARRVSGDPLTAAASLESFLADVGCVEVADFVVPEQVDAIVIDRGWGGVYQNAVDLWEALNKRHYVLLIAPFDPPYGFDRNLEHLLITPKRAGIGASFVAFVSLMRSLLKIVEAKLIICTHRALAPYLFDIAESRRLILYGDGHFERLVVLGNRLLKGGSRINSHELLCDLYFANGSLPNASYAKALAKTFEASSEIWSWTPTQDEAIKRCIPELQSRCHFILPLVPPTEPLHPSGHREWVLFTTTSEFEEIGHKGLDPLMKAASRIQGIKVRVVINHSLVATPSEWRSIDTQVIGPISKTEMHRVYEEALVNCRVSTNDSSPISVLESMAHGVPVIVSPEIAKNIPLIRHGHSGFVVEPNDIDSLEAILRQLLRDPELRNMIGSRGKEFVAPHLMENKLSKITERLSSP
jgi:glycosyltransferase involved in cell wall biosynthesis